MTKDKLYCYVDETGQDMYGKFFLVSVLLSDQKVKEKLEPILEELEKRARKGKMKWSSTPRVIKEKFLEELTRITQLRNSLFYSAYGETKTYTELTALSIAKAVNAKTENDYFVTIVIDGLTKKNTEKIRIELKKLKIKYKNIRGMKDEQSVFLRLADSIAGFVRDYIEKKSYAEKFFKKFKKQEMIKEA